MVQPYQTNYYDQYRREHQISKDLQHELESLKKTQIAKMKEISHLEMELIRENQKVAALDSKVEMYEIRIKKLEADLERNEGAFKIDLKNSEYAGVFLSFFFFFCMLMMLFYCDI